MLNNGRLIDRAPAVCPLAGKVAMHIEQLELRAADLGALRDYYATGFGLPLLAASDQRLELQAGATRLGFARASEGWSGRYHFAFTIPEDQFPEAKTWLAARTPLATDANGRDTFHSEDWDADSLYFYDPAGNIGELIARHTLDSRSGAPFGPASLLSVSEVGIAAPDLPATIAALCAQLGIATYGEGSDTFCPIGDERGLFIVVRSGRVWFPNTGIAARPLPLTAIVRNGQGERLRVVAAAEAIEVEALET